MNKRFLTIDELMGHKEVFCLHLREADIELRGRLPFIKLAWAKTDKSKFVFRLRGSRWNDAFNVKFYFISYRNWHIGNFSLLVGYDNSTTESKKSFWVPQKWFIKIWNKLAEPLYRGV